MDYGIMAATFVNLETSKAFRVVSTEESRDLARYFAPEISGKHAQQLDAYKRMPDNVLFRVQQVKVTINEFDMPGPTRRKATCVQCGQVVRDHREVLKDGRRYCRPCAEGAYFSNAREIIRPDMNWAPEQSARSLNLDHLKLNQSNKVERISKKERIYHIGQ
jgi:formylmethanofuran dehydrogenase subunit E